MSMIKRGNSFSSTPKAISFSYACTCCGYKSAGSSSMCTVCNTPTMKMEQQENKPIDKCPNGICNFEPKQD